MNGMAAPPDWDALDAADFVAQATACAEAWLAGPLPERAIVHALDEALQNRLDNLRAERRRSGRERAFTEWRGPAYLVLMLLGRLAEDDVDAGDAVRTMRAACVLGLVSQMAGEAVAGPVWATAHRAWRAVEAAGGEALAAAEPSYLLLLVSGTLSHANLNARQIDKCFDWLAEAAADLHVERVHDARRHYLCVDLDSQAGLVPFATATPGSDRRFVAHAALARNIAAMRSDYFRRISVATLGLYETNPLFDFHDALTRLEAYWEYVAARHSGRDNGRTRIDSTPVAAAAGFARCVRAVREPAHDGRWTLVDLSATGAGFRLEAGEAVPEKGALAVFADPRRNTWIIGSTVRVVAGEAGAAVGVRLLASLWRPVYLLDEHAVEPDEETAGARFGFFVFGDESRGLADSILLKAGTFDPARTFAIRPGKDVFKVRLARVIQSGADWERVGFDVQKK